MKTDYVQRLALLKPGMPRLVIRRSLNNMHVQIIVFEASDKTVVDVFSKSLRERGWKGHGGNLPAAYLTGYLAGLMALKQGIKQANVDIGLQISSKASCLYAAAAGVKDAGIAVSIGKEVLPSMDRIKGKHISDYAGKIKGTDAYKKRFSSYLRNNLAPEDLTKHFDEVKERIAGEFNVQKKVEMTANNQTG